MAEGQQGRADRVMDRILAVVARAQAGEREAARAEFATLWAELGPEADPLHRVTLAHHAADLQDDPGDELAWDVAALEAAEELTDARAQEHHASLTVAGFLPSLHLNLAEDHRRLGERDAARRHLAAAQERLGALGDDGYGAMIRGGIERLASRLDAPEATVGQDPGEQHPAPESDPATPSAP